MYVTRLECENLRTIANATIEFCVPTPTTQKDAATTGPLPNVTLLLGTNGAGKTTILRAIALAALAPLLPRSSGYAPRAMVRRTKSGPVGTGMTRARLRFTGQDGRKGEVDSELHLLASDEGYHERFGFQKDEPDWAELLWKERGPACFLVGYGASRRVDTAGSFALQMQEKERHPRFLRVAGLFEDSVVLRPLSSWLPQWDNPGRRKQLISIFNQVLDDVQIVDKPVDGQYLFAMDGAMFPFDSLSDGYRALIGWIADLLYHISRSTPSGAMLFQTEGIVLLDEVDLHLHPAWQKSVIPRLARAMPNIQFVFTSHSPLVVGSLHRSNVRIVRRSAVGTVVEAAPLEVFGLSADQILTSEYFGLETTREPGFASAVSKVAAAARGGDAPSAQQFLRMLTLGADAGRMPDAADAALPQPRAKATVKRAPAKKKSAPKRRAPARKPRGRRP